MEDIPLNSDHEEARTTRWRMQLGLNKQILVEQGAEYRELCHVYPLPKDPGHEVQPLEQKETPISSCEISSEASATLDPLSMMAQQHDEDTVRQEEIDRNYRKEKALRKRGVTSEKQFEEEPDDAAAYIYQIKKDLQRLPEHFKSEERCEVLLKVLFCFSSKHTAASGYLQGMHEIASYVLHALELENSVTKERDCFVLTQVILIQLFPAFDIGDSKPLERMSRRITSLLQPIWPDLYGELTRTFRHIPSQLIFAKWMRLLFSRELQPREPNAGSATGLVLQLWDALFKLASESSMTLLDAAEACAAARLWHQGNTVLNLCEDEKMHWFMNVPPETDVDAIIQRTRCILFRQDPSTLPSPPPAPAALVHQKMLKIQQQHQQQSVMPPMSTGQPATKVHSPLLDQNSFPMLTSFTEKIAAKTQSLQQRITQEWDYIQQEQQKVAARQDMNTSERQRSMEHQQQQATAVSTDYNLNYYESGDPPQRPSHTLETPQIPIYRNMGLKPPPPRSELENWSGRLQRHVGTLQEFVVQSEQQPGSPVPTQVWVALADLQVLQQHMKNCGQ